ncbi:paraquat-inducible protein A [Acinetobacter sp. MD2(2019)]|uniref:paraquat-inducible protein A n=1 Tax=Acinetobacter sp. MD2(2019) TaxID=2605273 RepID=UPI002D1EBAC0|nr:paraquat-inducible protein A [Acinetobacter sp. MD2(2019)]MEB3752877.1 paraquat-inducible protein A [Acinetobacter sp. MD2(2019)]
MTQIPISNQHTQQLTQFTSCEECDALYQRIPLALGEKAICVCCGAELYREVKSFNRLLALVLTALIIFIVANSFPIVKVEVQGNSMETTLLGAAWTMFHIHRGFVGFILVATTFFIPLINLVLLVYIYASISWFKQRPPLMRIALRTLHVFRVWAMVEVFLIGILVTLVKLIDMVLVIPEIALWAFAALSLFMVFLNAIQVQDIWDAIDRKLP